MSASTIEELAYYGIDIVLAYGLAGGLGTKALAMGAFYLVEDACAFDGTTPHYADERILAADAGLRDAILSTFPDRIVPVRAASGDAIYREDDALLDRFRAEGCDVVNLDSSHLYAVARTNAEGRVLRTIQCGVLSDVAGPGTESESTLSSMLSGSGEGFNPLEKTGEIVRFYVEELAARL